MPQETEDVVVDIPSKPVDTRNSLATPRSAHRNAAHLRPVDLDVYDSPSVLRQLFSPGYHKRTPIQKSTPLPFRDALGPTPQRNGRALGLFDMISPSTKSITPSKRKHISANLMDKDSILQTPSRKGSATKDNSSFKRTPLKADESFTPRPSRGHSDSPVSASKRFYLANFFATPTTRRLMSAMPEEDDDILGDLGMSPLAPTKAKKPPLFIQDRTAVAGVGTDAFEKTTKSLRPGIDVKHSSKSLGLSPQKPRTPPTRKIAGKGLTRIVEDLKVLEEEEFNDDYEALLEAEGTADFYGADGDEGVVEESGEGKQRVWKKKGQKRTTRRVHMQPSRAKPKHEVGPPNAAHGPSSSSSHTKHGDAQPIYEDETATPQKKVTSGREGRSLRHDAREMGEIIEEDPTSPTPTERQHTQGGEMAGARKGRPVKASAHVNYRALKIQRKGPGRGRFRRR